MTPAERARARIEAARTNAAAWAADNKEWDAGMRQAGSGVSVSAKRHLDHPSGTDGGADTHGTTGAATTADRLAEMQIDAVAANRRTVRGAAATLGLSRCTAWRALQRARDAAAEYGAAAGRAVVADAQRRARERRDAAKLSAAQADFFAALDDGEEVAA
jgi:hypothetical protein